MGNKGLLYMFLNVTYNVRVCDELTFAQRLVPTITEFLACYMYIVIVVE